MADYLNFVAPAQKNTKWSSNYGKKGPMNNFLTIKPINAYDTPKKTS